MRSINRCGLEKFLGHALLFVGLSLGAVGSAFAQAEWVAVAAALAPAGTIDFTPHGTQPGLNFDLDPTASCTSCHGGDEGTTQIQFRPYPSWAGSMMANATRDPVFFAALDVANNDIPGVGDYCLRCHTSKGWYGGHVVKPGYGDPNNDVTLGAAGCLLTGSYDNVDNTDNDYSGLSCHFCHRMVPNGPNGEPAYTENADSWIDDVPCANTGDSEPCRHGPYDYAAGDNTPPHPWEQSDFHSQSGLCATCHNVSTPDTDAGPLKTLKLADGTDTGRPFPVERTFSEWQQSQYAQAPEQTCQACHMPESEDPTATACSLGGYPNRTGNLPVHQFVGGNTWAPGLIKDEYADTAAEHGGVPGYGVGRQDSYDQTIAWARTQLMSAASVATSVSSYTAPGAGSAGSMDLAVRVTNLGGHKLPTGYAEGRRMWINVQVHDAGGNLVFESGAYDPTTGVLTKDSQARVYEVLQGIFNHQGTGACDTENTPGEPMFHFVLNDCIAKDNRIPPLGFQPVTADDPNGYDTRPVGATYPTETLFADGFDATPQPPSALVNYDDVQYVIPVPAGTTGPLTAQVKLYYQTSSKDYIEFLRDQAVDNGFAAENTMCMSQSNRPFVVGPQNQTRGAYLYQLWSTPSPNDPARTDRKSPPELMQMASATTP